MACVVRDLAWVLPALALGLGACGGGGDRLDLRTPRVQPTRAPAVGGEAEDRSRPEPVTKAEVAVIRGWADALRGGHIERASHYFAIPSRVSNGTPPIPLTSREDVRFFNRTLPCGARLIATERSVNHFVLATFRLTERPGAGQCGSGAGQNARAAFLIRHHKIVEWLRVPIAKPAGGDSSSSTS